jgi:cysteinyl-tRNA synthetase
VALTLYNTLTREKEAFKPLDRSNVRMYVCGPTVYDYAHVGNARPVIVFDVLFRLLRHSFGPDHVTYVRNITDVDDKINARAAEDYPDLPLNDAIRIVTEKTGNQFHADVAALGCLPPTMEPRATEHIAEMTAMIEKLVERGCAYVAEDHVLFDVSGMQDYGKLSRRSLDEMIAGARVEVAPFKRDPMDFVLWKPSKPGEPSWTSPCGIATPGRPGWHIECSAMSAAHLGEVFDIHGGGIDLLFPHHENEIAQSTCAHGTKTMANYWLHNGFLQVEGEKMSKSLGNFVTIHELLQGWPGDVLRFQMLSTHYRQPIDWTESRSMLARDELEDWADVLEGYYPLANKGTPPAEFIDALSDDLNTPEAMAALRNLYGRAKKGELDETLAFAEACKFLGFQQLNSPDLFSSHVQGEDVVPKQLFAHYDSVMHLRAAIANNAPEMTVSNIVSEIEKDGLVVRIRNHNQIDIKGDDRAFTDKIHERIDARNAARKAKNFAEADRIRDELAAMGIELKDSKDSKTGDLVTTWEVAR